MELQVNPNTVNKGYAYLQDQGIIYNQRGIGYFVSSGAVERTTNVKRDAFVRDELPRIFKTMTLIGMDMEELVGYWKQYGDDQNGGNR